jgi:hypothetical protein
MRVQALFATARQPPFIAPLLLWYCSSGEDLGEELGETFSVGNRVGWRLAERLTDCVGVVNLLITKSGLQAKL